MAGEAEGRGPQATGAEGIGWRSLGAIRNIDMQAAMLAVVAGDAKALDELNRFLREHRLITGTGPAIAMRALASVWP